MSQLNNWQPPRVTQIVLPRAAKRTVKGAIDKAIVDKVELAIDEDLTEQAMNGVAHLDDVRIMKARTNEANALMFQLESAFAARSAKKIAHRNSPLAGL